MSTVHNAISIFEKNETMEALTDCYGHEHATARGISSIKMRYASVPHTQLNTMVEDLASYGRQEASGML